MGDETTPLPWTTGKTYGNPYTAPRPPHQESIWTQPKGTKSTGRVPLSNLNSPPKQRKQKKSTGPTKQQIAAAGKAYANYGKAPTPATQAPSPFALSTEGGSPGTGMTRGRDKMPIGGLNAPPTGQSGQFNAALRGELTQEQFRDLFNSWSPTVQAAFMMANNTRGEGTWNPRDAYAMSELNFQRLADNAGQENPFEGAGLNEYGQPLGTLGPITKHGGPPSRGSSRLNTTPRSQAEMQAELDKINEMLNQWKPPTQHLDKVATGMKYRQYELLLRRRKLLQGSVGTGDQQGLAPGWVSGMGKWNP